VAAWFSCRWLLRNLNLEPGGGRVAELVNHSFDHQCHHPWRQEYVLWFAVSKIAREFMFEPPAVGQLLGPRSLDHTPGFTSMVTSKSNHPVGILDGRTREFVAKEVVTKDLAIRHLDYR
jgi:hypothetical protein